METKEALELYRMAYKRAADKDEDKRGGSEWVKDRVAQGKDTLKRA